MHIHDIENALILVGQNNTGKTTVLNAVRAAGGDYRICPEDFEEDGANIEERSGSIAAKRRCQQIPEKRSMDAGFSEKTPFFR